VREDYQVKLMDHPVSLVRWEREARREGLDPKASGGTMAL
jgi:hypothetical protein